MGRAYLDIYYIHWPDETTLFSETFSALQLAKEQGLINHIGVSNFSKNQILNALNYADISYVQAPMNILIKNRNKTLRQFCAERNIKFVSYNTLASGLLSGKYNGGFKFSKNDRRHRLSQFESGEISNFLDEFEVICSKVSHEGLDMMNLSLCWALAQLDAHQVIIGMKKQ